MTGAPVTLLFTDLVDSTGLLQRVGDERAQRILYAHRQLMREVLASHGGREVKWLGDGLLTTFASVADGVRCAVTMAQRARRPVAGERLGLRLGLHVGEVLPDDGDYVGRSVVLARRLCDRATAGQILCSGVVVELLRGRQGFTFAEVGPLALKGFAEPVAGYEVAYRPETGAALLRHTPFTGRTAELHRLLRRLDETSTGQGGVVLVAGELGIGKTRLLEEVTETARAQGALVLRGRCYEGEAARAFGPFAEALAEYVRTAVPEVVRVDLGVHASSLLRLVPLIGERLPDIPKPVELEPQEERVRLLDAVSQSLLATAARVPTVLVLDDLHWADSGTAALLRHVARFAPRARLLVLGAYRDVEVAANHPVAEALGTLPRETSYDQVALGGLDPPAVNELVSTVVERELPAPWVAALTRETSGNPFFLREVLLHLEEEGTLRVDDGRAPLEFGRLRVPDTVRQVITRRLARLSPATNRLLQASAAFTGGIDFEVARRVAALDEPSALDALDEALGAQLLVATPENHTYDFTHALVRHTLYRVLNHARQARLHRQLAEAMEVVYGARAIEHAAEIARHYHRSRTLPGAARGVPYCLAAAETAERTAAFADAATHLRAALQLLPTSDLEHLRVQARLGLALVWALRFDDAVATASLVATRLAAAGNPLRAADYLAEVLTALDEAGAEVKDAALARNGLEYSGEHHDATWALLKAVDILDREANDPTGLGIPLDTPETREVSAIVEQTQIPEQVAWQFRRFSSRADMEARDPSHSARYFAMGQYRRDMNRLREEATLNADQGKIGRAVWIWATVSRLHIALGEFAHALEARKRGIALAERLPEPSHYTAHLITAEEDWRLATDEGWDDPFETIVFGIGRGFAGAAFRAVVQASSARIHARTGRAERAIRRLAPLLPAIERAPAWAPNYVRFICDAAETLWLTGRTDWIEVVQRNLRAKVIEPDFHYVMMDGRLAMARLCALQRQHDEALAWFAKARQVLDEQGARPLRAIVDYDEALMYARRAAAGDAASARPLLEAALAQFRALGMSGWIRRAEYLLRDGREWSPAPAR
jgi:class 3 adenylate cyclase/tetratricopeptide (TPR) repeat protein